VVSDQLSVVSCNDNAGYFRRATQDSMDMSD